MTERMSYIAVKPCGCVVGAMADDLGTPHFREKMFERWRKDGLTIEHVPSSEVKERWKTCRCGGEQKKLGL